MALLLVAGCTGRSDEPDLVPPDLSATDRATCEAFLAALPTTLAGEDRRADDELDDDLAAAYGDPAIVVRCGAPDPVGFDPTVAPGIDDPPPCTSVNGVGWYVPTEELSGEQDATLTAVSYTPQVSVSVPRDYLPEGSAAALAELTSAVTGTLDLALTCT